MTGLVEEFAGRLGWDIRPANVVVEGTSDVAMIRAAERAYLARHGVELLGATCGVHAAGRGEEGGADNLSKRLQAIRQVSLADTDQDGRIRYRFIGLYDSDNPGRAALSSLAQFDRSMVPYRDLFPLRPVMPLREGLSPSALGRRYEQENESYVDLHWEIEDLVDPDLVKAFRLQHDGAIARQRVVSGRVHYDMTVEGKRLFMSYVRANATLDELVDVIRLIRSLMDYLDLPSDHIKC